MEFDSIHENEVYIMSIDSMTWKTEEFWLDPIAKWYSQEKNTAINHD